LWTDGRAGGIALPGGHVIDLEWKGGAPVKISVKMGYSGSLTLAGAVKYFSRAERGSFEASGEDVVLRGAPGEMIRLIS